MILGWNTSGAVFIALGTSVSGLAVGGLLR